MVDVIITLTFNVIREILICFHSRVVLVKAKVGDALLM